MTVRTAILLIGLAALAGPAGAQTVEISEWLVPWPDSRPRDPFVDAAGRVWFVGQRDNYVANLRPESGDFARYDLPSGSGPHNLVIDAEGNLWFAGNKGAYIGIMSPRTGSVERLDMPSRRARDPHTLALDDAGNVWFTVQRGNFVGRVAAGSRHIDLIAVETRRARPYGITVNSRGEPWAVTYGSNRLLRIDPQGLSIAEIELPDRKARPRRVSTTSDDRVWWTDFARGRLGRFDPQTGGFAEWLTPGGEDSEPYALAVDRFDRIWLVETGSKPNRFVGFNPATETFFSVTDIPSGGDVVRNMHYFEPAGEVWFATDTNYIGRAGVH